MLPQSSLPARSIKRGKVANTLGVKPCLMGISPAANDRSLRARAALVNESNKNKSFLRNRIRLELMPYLKKKFNPGISKVLARLPEVIQSDSEFLEKESVRYYKNLSSKTKQSVTFPKKKFVMLHHYLLIGGQLRMVIPI